MRFEYPGVSSRETAPDQDNSRPISPSNYGFVGQFEKGPVGEPIIIQNSSDLERVFGDGGKLSKILTSFSFDEGLQTAYIVREAADDAKRSFAALVDRKENVEVYENTADLSSSTDQVDEQLQDNYLEPGSVEVFFFDRKNIVDENQGVLTVTSESTYSFGLANQVIPSSVTIEYVDNTNTVLETFTDGGSGTLSGDSSGTGTIDYETGEVSLTLGVSAVNDGEFEADYIVEPINLILGEVFEEGVAGAEIYHGQLNYDWVRLDTVEFSWEDSDGTTYTATSDSNGDITGDATGSVTRSGDVVLKVGNNQASPLTNITVDYNQDEPFIAEDDGDGLLVNTSPFGALTGTGTVDYETGELSFQTKTLVDSDADGIVVYADYDNQTHRSQSIHPGEGTNDYRLSVIPNPKYQDVENGTYEFFRVFIEEDNGDGTFTVVDSFGRVNLDDVTNGKHISKILNDPLNGSNIVEIIEPIEESIPTELVGEQVSGVVVHTGEGTNREFTVKLDTFDSEIISGTLVIEYESGGDTLEIRDDLDGGLEGEVLSGSINYDTGRLVVEPTEPVKSGSDVTVEYVTDVPSDEVSADYSGGEDGAGITRDNVSNPNLKEDKRGIYALEDYGEEQMFLAAPEFASDPLITIELTEYAEERQNAVVLASPPQGYSAKQAKRWANRTVGLDTDRLNIIWPWINVSDPSTGNTLTVPPVSHYAGVAARVDDAVGPRQVPAGTEFGLLNTMRSPAKDTSAGDVTTVREAQINPIHSPNNREEPVLWGAFTQYPQDSADDDGKYAYINGRRVADAVRTQITFALYEIVFMNADMNTVGRARDIAFEILRGFYSRGAFAGNTEEEAFFLIADESNNPREQLRGDGLVRLNWGIAPHKPAEFIHQEIQKKLI